MISRPVALNTISLVDDFKSDEKLWHDIPSMLPKAQRSKARILVHFIKNLVTLDNAGRIVFDNKTMSNAVDVIKYLTAPLNFNVPRPFDILPLFLYLKNNGLPSSSLGNGREKVILSNKEPRKRKLFGGQTSYKPTKAKQPRFFYN